MCHNVIVASVETQYVVPKGQAITKAEELAGKISRNAPLSNFAITNSLLRLQTCLMTMVSISNAWWRSTRAPWSRKTDCIGF